jgi:phosphatidylserine/phosphatidylglycerophosphate/cardiolipin synthase-like enzyme
MAAKALILDDPWSRIGAACKKSRADVAVAYVGQGATRLLPLRAGSKLVVDASEAAVRSGQTDPKELLKYFRKGVEVFSQPRLHAKVFAFAKVAFVGSTNVSNRSASDLVEAAVALDAPAAVAQARRFVLDVASSPLGEEFLKKLVKIYRPPRLAGGAKRRKRRTKLENIADAAPLRLVQLVPASWDDEEMAADDAGRKAASKIKTRGHRLESFCHSRWPHRDPDEDIIQVLKESERKVWVHPPGKFLRAEKVRNKRSAIVVLEVPPKRSRRLSVIRKRLSRATAKRLTRGGLLSPAHAAQLREVFR